MSSDAIVQSFDVSLLLLSFVVAYFGSYMAISLSEQLRSSCMAHKKFFILRNFAWLMLIGLSLGGVGIWGMHFVGMAACIPRNIQTNKTVDVNFNVAITMISLLIAVLTISCGILIASQDRLFAKSKFEILEMFVSDTQKMNMAQIRKAKDWMIIRIMSTKSLDKLIVGGIIAGGGVCAMHYLGMEAIEFDGRIKWNAGIVAASILIAITAATAAFWILFRVLSIFPGKESLRQAAAIIMTVAVCGMHYTGMAAAMMIETGVKKEQFIPSIILHREKVAVPIYVTVTLVLWGMTVLIFADLRSTANIYRKVLKRTHQLDQVNAMSMSSEDGSSNNLSKSASQNRYVHSPNLTATNNNKKSVSISHPEDQLITPPLMMKPAAPQHSTTNLYGTGSSSNALLHPTPSSAALHHTLSSLTPSLPMTSTGTTPATAVTVTQVLPATTIAEDSLSTHAHAQDVEEQHKHHLPPDNKNHHHHNPHIHHNQLHPHFTSSTTNVDIPLFIPIPTVPSIDDSDRPHASAAIVPINADTAMMME